MNGKDFTSGFFIRKTDKEDFVKPSLPQQFRRQGFNVIGGGYEKDRLFVFLHPRQQRGEHSLAQSAVAALAGSGRKGLFDLINPEDGRRHRFDLTQRCPQIVFRFADVFVIEYSAVQTKQRLTPGRRDGFGAQTFAGALHPKNQNSPRRRQTKFGCFFAEGLFPRRQPFFKISHPADFVHRQRSFDRFEQPVGFNKSAFSGNNSVNIFIIQPSVGRGDLLKKLTGLTNGKPPQVPNDGLQPFFAQTDFERGFIANLAEGVAEYIFKFFGTRQRQFKSPAAAPNRTRQTVLAVNKHQHALVEFDSIDRIPQHPKNQMGLKMFAQIECNAESTRRQTAELLKSLVGGWVFRAVQNGKQTVAGASPGRPNPHLPAEFLGGFPNDFQCLMLFVRNDGQTADAPLNKPDEFLNVIHNHGFLCCSDRIVILSEPAGDSSVFNRHRGGNPVPLL